MANEILVSCALSAYKAAVMSAAVGRSRLSALFTMTASVYCQGVVSVGFAAPEAIPMGEVTTPCYCFLENFDGTNFVRVMNGSGGAPVPKLRAGQFACFPWDEAAVPYWQANTAACLCGFLILGL